MHRQPLVALVNAPETHPLDRLAHASRMVPVNSQHPFQAVPDVEKLTRGMQYARPGADPFTSRPLHPPPHPAVFHGEYIYSVAAKIRREQMVSAGVKGQSMRMGRGLRRGARSTAGVFENPAWVAQAAVLRNR